MPKQTADEVRNLIPSVTALANHLGISTNAIYGWIKVNRIPAKHLIRVAQFYDIDVPLHLAQSTIKHDNAAKLKPAETLPVLVEVFNGRMSPQDAADILGCHIQSVNIPLIHWGERFPLMVDTLTRLVNGEIVVGEAAEILGTTKFNVHGLRRKYGLRPERVKAKPKPVAGIHARKKKTRAAALACIEGKLNLEQAQTVTGLSWRTVHRAISDLSPDHSLIELTHWPKALRKAYSDEIDRDLPKIAPNLWKFAENHGILWKKTTKYPETPENWRSVTTKRMLIGVLLGEADLEVIAASRGADPKILESLFTSDLRPLDLTFGEVMNRPLSFQVAVAELILAIENPKRRLTHDQ